MLRRVFLFLEIFKAMMGSILFLYTDGWPNHRTTYCSAKFAHTATFIALDFDMLIAARTAPSQFCNPAERYTSLFNVPLENISLQKNRMNANIELRVKPATTLKKLRDFSEKESYIKTALQKSRKATILILKI